MNEGELLLWMKLADRNNWSLSEAMAKVTSSEFVLWKVFMEREVNEFHREDYFYAQIAREIRALFSKNPKRVKLEPFLIKFKTRGDKPQAESIETRTDRSKAYWFGVIGTKGPIDKIGVDDTED